MGTVIKRQFVFFVTTPFPFAESSFRGKRNEPPNQCVFIRGFRAKRVFLWTRIRGAADPLPDDQEPPSRPEGVVEVTRVTDVQDVSSLSSVEFEKCA